MKSNYIPILGMIFKSFKRFLKWISHHRFYFICICLLLFTFFALEPLNKLFYVKNHMNTYDILSFDGYYWLTLSFILILYSVLILIALTKKSIKKIKLTELFKKTLITLLVISFNAFWLALFLRVFVYQSALYINTLYYENNVVMTYKVFKLTTDNAYLINESDSDDVLKYSDLDILNEQRLSKNFDSIHHKKDGDTIQVYFRKGFLSELYLK